MPYIAMCDCCGKQVDVEAHQPGIVPPHDWLWTYGSTGRFEIVCSRECAARMMQQDGKRRFMDQESLYKASEN